jgi:hypothetical protein
VDVLGYIEWVWSMQDRMAHRLDPAVAWQRDLSWAELYELVGLPPIALHEPGEWVANTELAAQLYWPGLPPVRGG